jgi:dihydroorotate dehydrogenase
MTRRLTQGRLRLDKIHSPAQRTDLTGGSKCGIKQPETPVTVRISYMNLYKTWIRPFLFKLNPEDAHNLAKTLLKFRYLGHLVGKERLFVRDERLRVNLGGMSIRNPVGLAPGFDKDCEMLGSLGVFGFGYVVSGSVMCEPRPGNPRPRMVRLPEQKAVVSCMGLPSKGVAYVSGRLRHYPQRHVPLVVNCNGFNLQEYIKLIEVIQPLADGLEISLSCSNEADAGGDFLDPRIAETLFVEIAKRKTKPIFVKIPSYATEEDRQKRLDLVERALRYSIDGFATSFGSRLEDRRLATGYGTLSGKPLFQEMLRVVKDLYQVTRGRCHIKARGGIFSAEDAFEAIALGGSTVEVYTGLIYEGWTVARDINRGLLKLLDEQHIKNVASLRGVKVA